MKLSKREKSLIVIAVLLLIVLGYTTLISPYTESVEAKTEEIETLTNETTLVEAKLASISELEENILQAQQDREDSMIHLSAYQNDEELDTTFTAIAKKYSMDVLKMSISDNTSTFQTPAEGEEPEELAFTAKNVDMNLEYTASMSAVNFTPFIDMIMEISAREDTVVDSITYAQVPDGSSTTTVILNYTVSIVVFMEYEEG